MRYSNFNRLQYNRSYNKNGNYNYFRILTTIPENNYKEVHSESEHMASRFEELKLPMRHVSFELDGNVTDAAAFLGDRTSLVFV